MLIMDIMDIMLTLILENTTIHNGRVIILEVLCCAVLCCAVDQ
jgi:hypothetical protein